MGITVYFGKRKGSASTADLSARAVARNRREGLRHRALHRRGRMCRAGRSRRAGARHPGSRSRPSLGDFAGAGRRAAHAPARRPGAVVDTRITNSEGATVGQSPGRARVRQFAWIPRRLSLDQPQRELRAAGAGRRRHAARLLVQLGARCARSRSGGDHRPQGRRTRGGAARRAQDEPRSVRACCMRPKSRAGSSAISSARCAAAASTARAPSCSAPRASRCFPSFVELRERPHIAQGPGQQPLRWRRRGHARSRAGAGRRAAGLRARQLFGAQARPQDHRQCRRHAQPAGGIEEPAAWMSAALMRQLGTGLLVTELMGQGVNGVTGDYSRGASGFWVENGAACLSGARDHHRRQPEGHVPQHRRHRQRRRPARRRARGVDPDLRDDHRRRLANGDGPEGLRWRRRAVRSPGKRGRLRVARYACPRRTLFATSRSRALRKFPDGNFRRPLVGSGPPSGLQKWLRRDATRRRSGASSSPRSIRSQRESAVGRRTTRRGLSPFARRPYRTPPPPRSAAPFPISSHRGVSPRVEKIARLGVLVLAEPWEPCTLLPAAANGDVPRLLARGDRAVSVGAPSEG